MFDYSTRLKDLCIFVCAISFLCILAGTVTVSLSPMFALLIGAFILLSLLLPPLLDKLHIFLLAFIALIPAGALISLIGKKLTIAPLLGLFVFGLWCINLCTKKGYLKIAPELKWVFALIFVMFISSQFGINFRRSMSLSRTYIQLFVMFFLIIQIFRNPKHLYSAGWVLIISFTVVASSLLVSQILNIGIGSYYLTTYETQSMHSAADGYRNDPNYSCLDFSIATSFVLYYLKIYKGVLIRSFLAACLFVLAFAIIFTFSLGGTLGLMSAFFFFIIFNKKIRIEKKFFMFISLFPILFVTYVFIPPVFKLRLQNQIDVIQNQGFSEWGTHRGKLWLGALETIKENPVLGVGVGNGAREIARIAFFGSVRRAVAHNAFLSFAADNGIIGLFVFLMLVGSILKRLASKIKLSSSDVDHNFSYLGSAIFLSLLVFFVQSMFLSTEYDKTLWILLGLATSFINMTVKVSQTYKDQH